MKAAVFNRTTSQFDYLVDHVKPEVGTNELLIKVEICSLNSIDRDLLAAKTKKIASMPDVFGFEIYGHVVEIGSMVSDFGVGDKVASLIPIYQGGGFAEYVSVKEHHTVHIPSSLDIEKVQGLLTPGLRAYTCLHYKSKIVPGNSLLLTEGLSTDAQVLIQLASNWGVNVYVVVRSIEEEKILLNLQIINLKVLVIQPDCDLYDVAMEETEGLGFDHIVCTSTNVSNRDIIRSLAVHGTWVTTESLQLDPPESTVLLQKNANISFLCGNTWLLAPTQQGRLVHIMKDILETVATGSLRISTFKTFTIDNINKAFCEQGTLEQILIKM